jgi:oligopeptide/dipeptide ABC transporter ATP-binding protein
MSPEPLLSVRDLTVEFETEDGIVQAVTDVSYDLFPGEVLGIVGESGSGKSVSMLSVLGLIPQPPGRIVSGEAIFKGRDLLTLSKDELRKIRGGDMAMIFQDPMTSLNPVISVGGQIAEAIRAHNSSVSEAEAQKRTVHLLSVVGVPNPEQRYGQYPHEFSGGMRQRVMIAMAIANSPSVLVADEPTTALDVTIQAQIMEVIRPPSARRTPPSSPSPTTGADRRVATVVVMYAGRVVELADVFSIFNIPRHPYTIGLMSSLARLEGEQEWLEPIPGQPPSMISPPPGCAFHPRCITSQGRAPCRTEVPELRAYGEGTHLAACHYTEEVVAQRAAGKTGAGV